MQLPGFYEFFCGGGMARAGLGPDWHCLFANDFDAKKGASYADNWGAAALRVADIASLCADDLPGRADLAWASFPCQDLSLAGAGKGLAGARSGALWRFLALMRALRSQGRAPKLLALENVLGALTANGGEDFQAICRALRDLGYRFGALTIDAAHFTPQSRPRLFVVALRADVAPPRRLTLHAAPDRAAPALLRAVARFDPALAGAWLWWALPALPRRDAELADLVEQDPVDAPWHGAAQTAALVAMMDGPALRKIAEARCGGRTCYGALFRRTRRDRAGAAIVRAEVRFDGLAGCLRTPGGGSSRQFLIEIAGDATRTRLLSAREAARLMGLPETYRLPASRNAAYHLLGDGVVAPVVRHLSEALLLPLAKAQAAGAAAAAAA